jgi:hypothetical protein
MLRLIVSVESTAVESRMKNHSDSANEKNCKSDKSKSISEHIGAIGRMLYS